MQGRFREAIPEYKKILMEKPDEVEVYYNLGLALENAGQGREALYYYRKFAANAPADLRGSRERAKGPIEALSLRER